MRPFLPVQVCDGASRLAAAKCGKNSAAQVFKQVAVLQVSRSGTAGLPPATADSTSIKPQQTDAALSLLLLVPCLVGRAPALGSLL